MTHPKRFARSAALVCFVVFALAACGHKLSAEEQAQLASLKAQLATVRAAVTDAAAENAKYEGGLIKALVGVRLEVLKTNEALLDQRVQALESDAKITIVVNATKDDPLRAAEIASEITAQQARLAAAQANADGSGGLIGMMAKVTVATNENTLAMLQQQYLIAKYGLALAPAPTPASVPTK